MTRENARITSVLYLLILPWILAFFTFVIPYATMLGVAFLLILIYDKKEPKPVQEVVYVAAYVSYAFIIVLVSSL